MGDPKKPKKKYETPRHPWQKDVIEVEKALIREYGLKNKEEIWKMKSSLRNFKNLTKKYSSLTTEQSVKEQELFLAKIRKLGLLKPNQGMDEILGLELKDILERRLQTIVFRKNLANSMKQARQFIVHNHIAIAGKRINVPGYLVSVDQEDQVGFTNKSPMISDDHPEMVVLQKKKKQVE